MARARHDMSDTPQASGARMVEGTDPSVLNIEELLQQSTEKNLF